MHRGDTCIAWGGDGGDGGDYDDMRLDHDRAHRSFQATAGVGMPTGLGLLGLAVACLVAGGVRIYRTLPDPDPDGATPG